MNTKTITMAEYPQDKDIPYTLAGAIKEFSACLESIPEEYRDSAEIDFEPEYSHGEVFQRIVITYRRPMTPAELAADTEEMRAHWMKQLQDACERIDYCEVELARLKELDDQGDTGDVA